MLRAYSIGIALLLMLVETEWPWVLDGVRLLDNWVGRATVQVRILGVVAVSGRKLKSAGCCWTIGWGGRLFG